MKLYTSALLTGLLIIAGVILYGYVNPTPDAIRHAEIANQLAKMERARRIADIFWPSAAAIVLAALAGGARWVWRKSGAPEMVRAEDGLFPVLVWDRSTLRDRLTGRRRVTTHDANRAAAATLAITTEADGAIHASADIPGDRWQDQIAVTQAAIGVQKAQADASAQRTPKGPTVAQIKAQKGWYDNPPQPRSAAQVVAPAALPAPGQPAHTLAGAIEKAQEGEIVLGQQADAPRELAIWRPAQAPHLAILGSSQQGKSSGAAATAVLGAIRQGWRVSILDPEQASQWAGFAPWAEWAAVDGHSATEHAGAILGEFQRRGHTLAAAGAANISRMEPAQRPPRLLLLIEEYAVLRGIVRDAGRLDAFDQIVGQIAMAGAKLGVHLLLIGQSFRSADGSAWPSVVRNNCAARLSYAQPSNDSSKSQGGIYELSALGPGEFAYRGSIYRSWDAQPQAGRILANAPRRSGPGILDAIPGRVAAPVARPVAADLSDPPVRRIRPQAYTPPVQERGEGRPDSGHRTPDTGQPQGDALTDIQRAVAEYVRANPDAGVRPMARELGISKTYAGDLRAEYLGAPPEAPEPVFAATAEAHEPEEDEPQKRHSPDDWRGAREVLSREEWIEEVNRLRPARRDE